MGEWNELKSNKMYVQHGYLKWKKLLYDKWKQRYQLHWVHENLFRVKLKNNYLKWGERVSRFSNPPFQWDIEFMSRKNPERDYDVGDLGFGGFPE